MQKGKLKHVLLILPALLLLLLSGCRGTGERSFIEQSEKDDTFASLASDVLPSYRPSEFKKGRNYFNSVENGDIWECYDIEAFSALKMDEKLFWYPQYTKTVVLAVNEERTDAVIRDWEDLISCKEKISMIYNNNAEKQLIFGAVGYGTGKERPISDSAVDFLSRLWESGNLSLNNMDSPVLIIFDSQAAREIKGGRKLKMIVPQSGTLSFDAGLLSSHKIEKLPREKDLIAGGLRLTDGRTPAGSYPEGYDRAEKVKDAERFIYETKNVTRQMRRDVMHTRLYASADNIELAEIIMPTVVLIFLWAGSVVHRSVRSGICFLTAALGIQMIMWLVLVQIKYFVPMLSTAERYCWYGFYVFQIGMPLVLLWISIIIDDREDSLRFPLPMKIAFPAGLLLVAAVFTNDLHNLVFRFDLTGNWSDIYTYGPLYYLIYAFSFIVFGSAVVLLIVKSARSPGRWKCIFPLASSMLLVIYTVGYALRWPFAKESNYAWTFCMLSLLFMEATLHTGLIPANTQYKEVFTGSSLALQVLNSRGETVLSSETASELPSDIRRRLTEENSVRIFWKGDSVLMGRAIKGGAVVWEEDRSALNAMRREICEFSLKLEAANALLRKEGSVKRKKLALISRTELFESLENEMVDRTEELSDAINSLPHAKNRNDQIAYITLLLCYIKRRCNLFFLAREGKYMPVGELSIYLDELSEFGQYAGVRVLNSCFINGDIDVGCASLFYDFCFTILAWSAQTDKFSLIGELKREEKSIKYRVLSSQRPEKGLFSQSFLDSVREAGGSITHKELDEETGIYLVLPTGGKDND